MSWHDAHVHGLKLENFREDEGSCDLALDINYLLQWHPSDDGAFRFTVCRAELRFHEISGLKLALDYAGPTAGMCPFMLQGIEREALQCLSGGISFHWQILINWPRGSLQFDAPEFTQTMIGEPVLQEGQWLSRR